MFRLILLNKLLEDGNVLYKKNRLQEAALRYQYALNKFPSDVYGEYSSIFHQLRINFLLNQSRCKRKMNVSSLISKILELCFVNKVIVKQNNMKKKMFQDFTEAVELATQVLSLKPDSFEAFYARAKGRIDLK